jgi:uncharacterized protein YoaH (UPF0181 family)
MQYVDIERLQRLMHRTGTNSGEKKARLSPALILWAGLSMVSSGHIDILVAQEIHHLPLLS